MNKDKEIYQTPQIEIIEFEVEDNIASSGDFGPSLICGEEM